MSNAVVVYVGAAEFLPPAQSEDAAQVIRLWLARSTRRYLHARPSEGSARFLGV